MSTIRFQLHSIQFKNKNAFETYFPYHTIFSLIIGFHLGRHLGYIEMLNDARVASLGIFKYNVCTTRINIEKKPLESSSRPPKIRPNSAGLFYVFSVLCLLSLCARLFICTLWSPTGKGLAYWP